MVRKEQAGEGVIWPAQSGTRILCLEFGLKDLDHNFVLQLGTFVPLTCVGGDVALEVASVSKRLVTPRTFVRFLARVQSSMGLQVALVRKGLPTHLTAGEGVNRDHRYGPVTLGA